MNPGEIPRKNPPALLVAGVVMIVVALASCGGTDRAPAQGGGGREARTPQRVIAMAEQGRNFHLIEMTISASGQIEGQRTLVYYSDDCNLRREDGEDKKFTGRGTGTRFQSQNIDGAPNTGVISGNTLTFDTSVGNITQWDVISSTAVFDAKVRAYTCKK